MADSSSVNSSLIISDSEVSVVAMVTVVMVTFIAHSISREEESECLLMCLLKWVWFV